MNEIIFLDIDYTLIRPESKLAIIDKDNPGNIIMRIESTDEPLLTSIWKKFDLKVDYNGKIFWLNPELYKAVKRRVSGINLDRIGISYREWTDKELLDQQAKGLDFLLYNLKSLKDSETPIALLTARGSKEAHNEFIKKIKEEISLKLRLPVIKEYFISDMDSTSTSDLIASRKSKIILEHLIGFKIKSNRFIDLKQSEYTSIKFFDDDIKNVEAVRNLQELFEICLKNTDKSIKTVIMNRVKDIELNFETNLVTNNDLNPFITNNDKLVLSNESVDLFETFRFRNRLS